MKTLTPGLLAFVWLLSGCGTIRYGLALKETVPTSCRPTLAWEKFPAVDGTEFTNVTYELRVLGEADGKIAYSRKGLTGTEHIVEEALAAGAAYRWSVRPWFVFRGAVHVGPWAQRLPNGLVPGRTTVPVPLDYFTRLETPRQ